MKDGLNQFQVFAKPAGAGCNLNCDYCYYLEKEQLYPDSKLYRMTDEILEAYIKQHIKASKSQEISFHWHGGEPTILGLDYFRRIVALQRKFKLRNFQISNNIQTNGTLLDEGWGQFLSKERFTVGLSLDGPQEIHDRHRAFKGGKPSYKDTKRGYDVLKRHGVSTDILCVVNALNVQHPSELYRFFKEIGAQYISFIPLVEPQPDTKNGVSDRSVLPEDFGSFLCTIFDEWKNNDIGRIMVQMFEEVSRTALGNEHALCIFRRNCGDVPVIEHNGDLYSCDHFVDTKHRLGNILETPLDSLLGSPAQLEFGADKYDRLPQYCRDCEFLEMCHGGCPKDRIVKTPDGETGLNYLCRGYKAFFAHCRPFLQTLASINQQQLKQVQPPSTQPGSSKPGRNDPCFCGSGKKYKKCCMNNPS